MNPLKTGKPEPLIDSRTVAGHRRWRRWLIRLCVALTVGVVLVWILVTVEPVRTRRGLRLLRNSVRRMTTVRPERKARLEPPVVGAMIPPVPGSESSTETKDQPFIASAGLTRLLRKPPTGAANETVQRMVISLDGQTRNGIVGRLPFWFSYRLTVPEGARLRFAVNQDGLDDQSEIRHAVAVKSAGAYSSVWERVLAANHHDWTNQWLDLSDAAGQEIELLFESTDVVPSTSDSTKGRGYWADLWLETPAAPGSTAPMPNVIVFLIDTLRADHLGCYGYDRPTSPNLDALASSGVRFERAITSAPWTDPSILSLLTGRYPSDVWVAKGHREMIRERVPRSVRTMAEIFADAGYVTIAASDHPGINAHRFGNGFDVYLDLYHDKSAYVGWRETPPAALTSRLGRLLDGCPTQGLFAYIHLIYPHTPYEPPPPYDGMFGRGSFFIDSAHVDGVVNMYDGEIRQADDTIGRILTRMKETGQDQGAIVLVLSDHGEGFWEHGLYEHGNSLFNELLQVPMILTAPGRLPKGAVVTELVRTVDVLPTLIELAGLPSSAGPPGIRGVSLVPVIRGASHHESAYSEFPHSRMILGRSIQDRRWKLIVNSGSELFDLDADRGEFHDIWSVEQSIAERLRASMEMVARSAAELRATVRTEQSPPSSDLIDKLRTLGYVDD